MSGRGALPLVDALRRAPYGRLAGLRDPATNAAIPLVLAIAALTLRLATT